MKMTLSVNGNSQTLELPDDIPLLWVLRDHLGLTGTKYGCGMAQCGSCTVLIDGRPVRSCVTRARSAQGKDITTIEANTTEVGETVVSAWNELNVHQCGFCQSGQVMAATGLLMRNSDPDDDAIDRAMSGCICRCGTYERVRSAIKQAATQLNAKA